jgi:hypothetical protein
LNTLSNKKAPALQGPFFAFIISSNEVAISSFKMYIVVHIIFSLPKRLLMKKHYLLVALLLAYRLFAPIDSVAQPYVRHYEIGKNEPTDHEIGVVVKALPDGSSIIAGYHYDTDLNVNGTSILLMRMQGATLLWSKQLDAGKFDMVTEMIITRNEDIILVGYSSVQLPGGPLGQQKSIPAIYRLDASGNLLSWNIYQPGWSWGDGGVFSGVCELQNGMLVAVGPHATPENGIIVTYGSNLALINSDIVRVCGTCNDFLEITSVMNHPHAGLSAPPEVIICGSHVAGILGAHRQPLLLTYRPSLVTGVAGTVVAARTFDIHTDDKLNAKFTQIYYQRVFSQVTDRIFCNGILSPDLNAQAGSQQFSFQCDFTNTNVKVHPFDNTNAYTNTSRMVPISYNSSTDDFGALTTENPDANLNDPIYGIDMPIIKGLVSKVTSLDNHSVDYSRSFRGINGAPPSFVDVHERSYLIGNIDFATGSIESAPLDEGKNLHLTVFDRLESESDNCGHNDENFVIDDVPGPSEDLTIQSWSLAVLYPIDDIYFSDYSASVRYCGENPIQTSSECGSVSLSAIQTGVGPGGECYFSVTANTSNGLGWTVTSYNWSSIPSSSPFPYTSVTNSSTNTASFFIANLTSITIYVTVNLINGNNQTCKRSASVQVNCGGHPRLFNPGGNPSSTVSLESSGTFSMYPNPARDNVTIEFALDHESNVKVDLVDATGRAVRSVNRLMYNGLQKVNIETKDLAPGIYNVKVKTKSTQHSKTLTIIK